MKISILLTLFLIPVIFSYNLTKFLEPQNELIVDAIIKIMDESIIPKAVGVTITTTPKTNSKYLPKRDMIAVLCQRLKEKIKYRLIDQDIPSMDKPRYNNIVFLRNYEDFR